VHEILGSLGTGALVLDVGSNTGSFPEATTDAIVVRIDLEVTRNRTDRALFVQGDSARLPFADRAFDAVISNHSLEHFDNLFSSLREIGRVISPCGALFVAVPDASTVTDRLYRWLARGGGHVNAFTSHTEVADTIERATGLPHVATKTLCSSLSFLNHRNSPQPRPRRLLFLGAGCEWSLFFYAWLSRRLDRLLNVRTSIYGWALYFGNISGSVDTETWVNVCIRCGSGFSASFLVEKAVVRSRVPGFRTYQCPQCGAINPFADDYAGETHSRGA
jgi:SAM-dependent methyltransferase